MWKLKIHSTVLGYYWQFNHPDISRSFASNIVHGTKEYAEIAAEKFAEENLKNVGN